ncbi:tetratricopeptide repeat-containing sulfotransferase family protein [Sphingomonas bacterium]|uniref:tetratricopeptide repeat-containing sulfotransferase family protein n=1 Tax=Sphingomonas bacterium TaxID=1895847 RepID=UPI0020C6450A|nr:tetratricopeptide repeat-containing sulfotransferase family protein [Sphingomonas bacterium]
MTDDAALRLKRGDITGCIAAAELALAKWPEHPDALYILAVGLRYAHRLDEAEVALGRLLDVLPDHGRALQEQGHIMRAKGRMDEAARAYGKAVALNPSLEASWRTLQAIHQHAGQPHLATEAERQAAWLAALPRELAAVENLIAEKRLLKAEALCRAFLKVNPRHIEAMRQLAVIGLAMNILDDAETLLQAALEIAPDDVRLLSEQANVLNRRQKYAEALRVAERLAELEPGKIAWQVLLGNICVGLGAFERAIAIYETVLQAWPQAESVHLSCGHALKTIGRQDAAIGAYRAAYQARPDFGDAYWSLANLKTYRFTDAELDALRHWQGAPRVTEIDRIHLNFALGKALEDRGDYAASFAHYEQGNALKRARSGYDADRFDDEITMMIAATPPELFARSEGGSAAPDPIFVVGLPRSGSTLIEQILASHSLIDGTAELPNVLAQVQRLSGRTDADAATHYPHDLATLSTARKTAMGERYIADTRTYRAGAPFFIDKMPNNFRHLGLIALMLPKARIIDARREPMACCFSGFKQLFAEGQEFSYGLEQIGRYYRGYTRLMDHWDEALPGRILTVHHEDLLQDVGGQTRRMLDFLGLALEESCLKFYETARAVRTASSEQVRRPIDRSGADQWRNFEPYLGALKAALGV